MNSPEEMRLVKRDGGIQPFRPEKIRRALLMAFDAVQPDRVPNVAPIVGKVVSLCAAGPSVIGIEAVQDHVERSLMEAGFYEVARSYIRYREARALARSQEAYADPSHLRDYIHVAKYARLRPGGIRETYAETVARVEEMHLSRFPGMKAEIARAFDAVREMRVLPSMRSMQFGGRSMLGQNARGYNCSFSLIDRPRAFQELFYLLLCGCGVGFSVQWPHVEMLPEIRRMGRGVIHYSVPDSIDGWSDSLGMLIEGAVQGNWVEFDYSGIRPEGAPLFTSGGLAPGHLPLRRALETIREMLARAADRKLRPIECHDICCHVTGAVLAGGIRRASLISLFSLGDTEMLYAKAHGHFEPGGLNDQRAMANNSAVLMRRTCLQSDFARVLRVAQEGYGEPGFFFAVDPNYGTNPCGEIGLNPVDPESRETGFSFCNLTEVNCARAGSREELLDAVRAASFIGTLQASYADFPYLGPVTENIARREALLGVGLTGMADNPELAFDAGIQRTAALIAVHTNVAAAALLGIRPAARVTTIKPSGTASLELGCVGSGIHPHHAKRYFRRVTANRIEAAAGLFRAANPHAVEEKPNGDLALVFPVNAPAGAITVKEERAMDFLARVFAAYDSWILPGTARPESSPGLTHNVSCTVTVRPGEMEEVAEAVWANRYRIAAMSFAPYLLDRKFPYAPREEVLDDERWNRMVRLFRPVDWASMRESSDGRPVEPACEGPSCEIDHERTREATRDLYRKQEV